MTYLSMTYIHYLHTYIYTCHSALDALLQHFLKTMTERSMEYFQGRHINHLQTITDNNINGQAASVSSGGDAKKDVGIVEDDIAHSAVKEGDSRDSRGGELFLALMGCALQVST